MQQMLLVQNRSTRSQNLQIKIVYILCEECQPRWTTELLEVTPAPYDFLSTMKKTDTTKKIIAKESEYIQIQKTKIQLYVDCKTKVSDDP